MSHPFSDCFSDLLCCEEAGILAGDKPPEYLSEIEFLVDEEDFMAELVAEEREYSPGFDYPTRFRSGFLHAAVREEAIAWILKVHSYHHFQPLTAYLSVNYMDRFLASHRLPQASGWPLQLLSVASLSLAAKMEETLVPSLLDLQVEGTSFIFEPGTICRMELLVLNALNWRLRSITPFNFIDFFAYKVDPTGAFIRYLVSFAVQIILATIQEVEFTDYWPSSVAAAAILCAADAFPNLSLSNPGNAVSWCAGLSQEKILSCYQLMQLLVVGNKIHRSAQNLLPQLKARSWTEMVSGNSTSSFSRKRRKLNNCLWADDDYRKQ